MKLLPLVLLLLSPLALADQWTYFYPESVTSVSCKVEPVELQLHGSSQIDSVYMAIPRATRNDPTLGDWSGEVGRFPATDKGLDQANKACMKWIHEARKKIRKARPATLDEAAKKAKADEHGR